MRLAIFGSNREIMRNLKYSIFIFSAAAFVSCSDEMISDQSSPFLNGSEKTPLSVTALLESGSQAQTRATDMSFENGDQFVAYLRHVTWNGENSGARASVEADKAPLLVTFTKGSTAMSSYTTDIFPIGLGGSIGLGINTTNTQQTSDLTSSTSLYWDDFSNSASAETDLRTNGHYLESYYGYCYNGSPALGESGTSITSALNPVEGILGWSVQADQSNGIKTSDLLWSAEQTPIQYSHNVNRPSLILPYTHAMSKVTIELVLNEGFDVYPTGDTNAGKAKAFGENNTTPKLYANRVTTTTAPTYTHSTVVAAGDAARIQMRLANDEVVTNGVSNKTRVYEAIIAPTVMKNGQKLAEVTVDGNRYDIGLTEAILNPSTDTNKWSSKLNSYTESGDNPKVVAKTSTSGGYSEGNGGITLAGVNYRIRVELNKQKSGVTAYITDWNDVYASTTGTISFNADVVTSVVTGATAVTAGSFDLWRSTANTGDADYDNDTSSNNVIDKASTYTYTGGKWVGDPTIYWKNGTTKHYFRALAKAKSYGTDSNGKTTVTEIESVEGSTAVAQTYDATNHKATSVDLLWAQTSKHEAKDANGNYLTDNNGNRKVYEAGDAIDPRSGNVPLSFQHAMSKISIQLATGADAVTGLENATISIINLYDGGTISVKDGTVSNLTKSSAAPMTIKDIPVTQMQDFLVVPQSLVKLEDGSDRTLTPTFYSSEELTGIYSDGTTHEPSTSETPTYYLTSQLVRVDAVLYSEEVDKITEHNAGLPEAVSTTSVKHHEEAVSYTYIEFNDDKVFQNHEVLTEEIFNAIDQSKKVKTPAVIDYYNETLEGFNTFLNDLDETKYGNLPDSFRKKSGEDGVYPLEDFKTYFNNLSETEKQAFITDQWLTLDKNQYRVNPTTSKDAVYYTYEGLQTEEQISADLFNALPDAVKIKTPEVNLYYTTEEAIAYNSKLPGAWHEGEVKTPAYYKLPNNEIPSNTTLTPYVPGSLKDAGNKIMLYVYLADRTRYSADLSTCLVADENYNTEDNAASVTTWEGNHHYKYKITLTKAKIELRALIKDWVEYKVSGNATLDWD